MDNSEAPGEYALRSHIRQLLLNYAVTHITTDYIQLTEQAVTDLWCQYLVEIPTADPHSLLLPTDPFDTLKRIHGLGSIEAFLEKSQSTPSAIQYIKKLIKPKSGQPKSDQVTFQESNFESYIPVCRPMSPILTTRAIRETPRAGTSKFLKSLPPSSAEFLLSQAIKPIGTEPVLEPSVKQDDVLNTNWRLHPGEHDAVRSLLRSVLAARPKEYKNRHLDFYTRPDSPPLPSPLPEAPFIPIFPRRSRAGSGVRQGDPTPSGLKGIVSLPAVILPPVKMEEVEPDLQEQNMVIVNGWQAYKSSPSPTPTPTSSQEDQIDELFMSSPDTTPPPVRPAKMEVVQIPRTHRIGGKRTKPPSIGHETDLGSFLAPLVGMKRIPKSPSCLSPEPATSMLGQPDSACEAPVDIDQDDLDTDVGRLYGHQRQDPRHIILKERVDEKRQLLIDVPVLPPPNEHPPNALFLPSCLGDLVAPLKVKGQTNGKTPTHQFLKKAKGIPSLNVELSWVPIAAKTRIPTNLEILKVTGLFDTDTPSSSDPPMQIATLLGKVPATLSASELQTHPDGWRHRYNEIDPEGTSDDLDLGVSRCEIILSRKERRRAAGLADEEEYGVEDFGDAMDTEDALMVDDRYTKRPRLARDGDLDDSGIVVDRLDFDHGKRPRLADDYLDDSGIAFDRLNFDHGEPSFYLDLGSHPADVDKENLPPFHNGSQYDDLGYDEYTDPGHTEQFGPEDSPRSGFVRGSRNDSGHKEFEALSFESHPAASAQPTQLPADERPSDEAYARTFEPAIINDSAIPKPSRVLNAPDIATRSLGIAEFAKLRARKVSIPIPESHPISAQGEANTLPEEPSHSIPESIYDRNTLRLPSTWNLPDSLHRYMVSMELVQKQGLVRCLRSRACSIDLVERDALGGVDIILDPHTAIIFTNLLVLPSECADLVSRIGQQSWLYSRLLVIFDAYPAAHSYQSKVNSNTVSELFAYTPPVLKALGKLRRDLGISEGCGTKRQACTVQYAFADTVDEAAMFTRYFGDFAEANDESRGIIWGDRAWLDDDVPEGEQDLAAVDGMNRFAAFVILCQIDLGEFLELGPEVRVEKFGVFVGLERIVRNACFHE
ncbi:hypothetical protein C8R44DRAFT_789150 [Mycena epipterygia]|nr:hypothetical protein C8R44DRAFT_789150 [Mycena epipterygia]